MPYPGPMLEALCVAGTPVTKCMSEINIVAMLGDADISLVQELKILEHLCHQFETKTFIERIHFQMLCKGHTLVKTGFAIHAYKDGKEEKRLHYSHKDIEKKMRYTFHDG